MTDAKSDAMEGRKGLKRSWNIILTVNKNANLRTPMLLQYVHHELAKYALSGVTMKKRTYAKEELDFA